jgi:hypothetical protein
MVQKLLSATRGDAHPDYDRDAFEGLLRERFDIVESRELPSETRTLYSVRAR